MIDLRKEKILNLTSSTCLKEEATYQFEDEVIKKKLIAKFIAYYDDDKDEYLIAEFKKIALLSAEPEIATVYFLATGDFGNGQKSCYVMDFVEGKTLGKTINDLENFSPHFIIDILSQIAKGMEKSHHYEISHGDLHEENILINKFDHVKIIDFLWWDFKLSFQENALEDVKSFKLISSTLMSKSTKEDQTKYKFILDYLENIENFNRVSSNILILAKVAEELALIDELSKEILSLIISEISTEATLAYVIQEKNLEIPEKYITELTDKHKGYIESEMKSPLKFSDTRGLSTQENIKTIFNIKLHQLKQAGLIDWEMAISNQGEKFLGPYVLNYQIHFTPKLFKWKRLNEEFCFLPTHKKKFIDLLLD